MKLKTRLRTTRVKTSARSWIVRSLMAYLDESFQVYGLPPFPMFSLNTSIKDALIVQYTAICQSQKVVGKKILTIAIFNFSVNSDFVI